MVKPFMASTDTPDPASATCSSGNAAARVASGAKGVNKISAVTINFHYARKPVAKFGGMGVAV
jgi:hypothetical protein